MLKYVDGVLTHVLAAERTAQAQLVEADAEATRPRVTAEREAVDERTKSAAAYAAHPALLRLEELAALREPAMNANARLYLDFKEVKDD